jgi:hypothetical protein
MHNASIALAGIGDRIDEGQAAAAVQVDSVLVASPSSSQKMTKRLLAAQESEKMNATAIDNKSSNGFTV